MFARLRHKHTHKHGVHIHTYYYIFVFDDARKRGALETRARLLLRTLSFSSATHPLCACLLLVFHFYLPLFRAAPHKRRTNASIPTAMAWTGAVESKAHINFVLISHSDMVLYSQAGVYTIDAKAENEYKYKH